MSIQARTHRPRGGIRAARRGGESGWRGSRRALRAGRAGRRWGRAAAAAAAPRPPTHARRGARCLSHTHPAHSEGGGTGTRPSYPPSRRLRPAH